MTLFELEEQIMQCWSIVDDLKNLRQVTDRREMSPDEVDNYVLGLETIYHTKFERLFATYEQLLIEQANSRK